MRYVIMLLLTSAATVINAASAYINLGDQLANLPAFDGMNMSTDSEDPQYVQSPRGYSIPLIDLASQKSRQVVVDKEEGQYLGHPTTVLLEDDKTIIVVYPKGHGRGAIVMKRSMDGGLTWSDRLSVPKSWATSKETPTIHRVIDPHSGAKRLVIFSGLYPIRMSVSEDDGFVWSELEPIGEFGGIVRSIHLIKPSSIF